MGPNVSLSLSLAVHVFVWVSEKETAERARARVISRFVYVCVCAPLQRQGQLDRWTDGRSVGRSVCGSLSLSFALCAKAPSGSIA